MEAVVLAGGLGTRLRSVVNDVPKSMAMVGSVPFLQHQLGLLYRQGIRRFILSVGYKKEYIIDYFGYSFQDAEIVYAIETQPLGTGGAIKAAAELVKSNEFFVLNGDSIFVCPLKELLNQKKQHEAEVCMALKPLQNYDRYGTILLNNNDRITAFTEKQFTKKGLINAGIYLIDRKKFLDTPMPEIFSIEKEYFQKFAVNKTFYGYIHNGYFLDIGCPEDYLKSQMEIGIFSKIDTSWTLFLDRDGVINRKIDNDYVRDLSQLDLLGRAIESIATLSNIFGKTIVVTNQQCIGKGIVSVQNVEEIHQFISQQVARKSGKIDKVYFAPQLSIANSDMRKPNIGMALSALSEFPEIDFSRSIMVGDSESDRSFAHNAGMHFVRISSKNIEDQYNIPSLDSLSELIQSLFI